MHWFPHRSWSNAPGFCTAVECLVGETQWSCCHAPSSCCPPNCWSQWRWCPVPAPPCPWCQADVGAGQVSLHHVDVPQNDVRSLPLHVGPAVISFSSKILTYWVICQFKKNCKQKIAVSMFIWGSPLPVSLVPLLLCPNYNIVTMHIRFKHLILFLKLKCLW